MGFSLEHHQAAQPDSRSHRSHRHHSQARLLFLHPPTQQMAAESGIPCVPTNVSVHYVSSCSSSRKPRRLTHTTHQKWHHYEMAEAPPRFNLPNRVSSHHQMWRALAPSSKATSRFEHQHQHQYQHATLRGIKQAAIASLERRSGTEGGAQWP